MTTTAETAPFQFFDLEVIRTRRLGPSLLRVTFTGTGIDRFAAGGRDQSLTLFLPHPGQDAPVVPVPEDGDMYAALGAWRALPDDVRAVLRSYTVREHRPDAGEFDIDFALHDDGGTSGPASRWAAGAAPGHRAMVLGPAVADNTAVRCRPPAGADHLLLWADETALPAAAAILEWLPAEFTAQVWLSVRHSEDRQEIATKAGAAVTWLVAEESADGAPDPVEVFRAAGVPDGVTPYAWIAGESGVVKELRRHLVRERGIDKRAVTFVGYWKRGVSEDGLRDEAAAEAAAEAAGSEGAAAEVAGSEV